MAEIKIEYEKVTIPTMMSIPELHKTFGISELTIRKWLRAGLIPHIECGKKWLVNAAVFSRFLGVEESQQPQTETASIVKTSAKSPSPKVIII